MQCPQLDLRDLNGSDPSLYWIRSFALRSPYPGVRLPSRSTARSKIIRPVPIIRTDTSARRKWLSDNRRERCNVICGRQSRINIICSPERSKITTVRIQFRPPYFTPQKTSSHSYKAVLIHIKIPRDSIDSPLFDRHSETA